MLANSTDTIRRNLDQSGWCAIEKLISKTDVQQLRFELVDGIEPHRFCSPVNRDAILKRFYSSRVFKEIFKKNVDPTLSEITDELDLFLVPRVFPRILLPGTPPKNLTPAHQDIFYIQGTDSCLTCWIPLSECTLESGGLEFLSGSHKLGLQPVVESDGEILPYETILTSPTRWDTEKLGVGDVFVFKANTIHRSRPNLTKNARISIDLRLQPRSHPIADSCILSPFKSVDLEGQKLFQEFIDLLCKPLPQLAKGLPIRNSTYSSLRAQSKVLQE